LKWLLIYTFFNKTKYKYKGSAFGFDVGAEEIHYGFFAEEGQA
jgi:hypothetical protein